MPCLDTDLNEFCLFHGTLHEHVDSICEGGFDERVSKLEGLYGGGVYFAEDSCKAHQYAKRGGCVFLCRVVLGDVYYTKSKMAGVRRPPKNKDSVVADYNKHREFVVYDRHQVYPVFILYYQD